MISLINLLPKKREITVNDIGIYQDVLTINTLNEETHPLKFDVFAKVRAKSVFGSLVEIEVVEITVLNSCNDAIHSIISDNIPKYIKIKKIKWETKEYINLKTVVCQSYNKE
jgi:hypothetical protein